MMTFSTYRESTSWFPLIRSLTRFRCTQIAGLLSQVNILVSSSFSSSLIYLFQSGFYCLGYSGLHLIVLLLLAYWLVMV
jgi:hypothetical protein